MADAELEELTGRLETDLETWAEPDRPAPVPVDLDRLEPGPVLAALLSSIDVGAVSGHDRVRVLAAHQRMIAHHQAGLYQAMTAVSDALVEEFDDLELAEQGAASEIRAALRLTRRAADHQLGVAQDLRRRLPSVWRALLDGRVDERRAVEFVNGTAHLPVSTAREVADRLLDQARGWTATQLRQRIRRVCHAADPADASDRYDGAVDLRRLVTEATVDGTVHLLGLDLPAERAAEAVDRINRIANSLATSDETRSMDQLRADILLDLLCGTSHPQRGSVHLSVDLATLSRLADDPGDLAGYGPVVADLTRRLADQLSDTTWSWAITDPATGMPVAGGTTRRRPTTRQRRRIQQLHPTCVFPGCRAPAIRADLDHTIPWAAGGATTVDNLAPLCRHDHTLRHRNRWTYTPTESGDWTWTSPLGYTHTTSGRDP